MTVREPPSAEDPDEPGQGAADMVALEWERRGLTGHP
jgi:hypothetical protein